MLLARDRAEYQFGGAVFGNAVLFLLEAKRPALLRHTTPPKKSCDLPENT